MTGRESKAELTAVRTRTLRKANHEKKIVYLRKLSADEISQKYIVVLKSELRKFPPPGTPFTVRAGEQNYRLQITSLTRDAVGPGREICVIWAGKLFVASRFCQGDSLVFTKVADRLYQLRVV